MADGTTTHDIAPVARPSGDTLPEELAALLQEELGSLDDLTFVLRTRTRVDTGQWFRKRCLWIAARPGEIVCLADGVVPLVERIAATDLDASLYSHLTGTVIFGPHVATVPFVRLAPRQAARLLAHLGIPGFAGAGNEDG